MKDEDKEAQDTWAKLGWAGGGAVFAAALLQPYVAPGAQRMALVLLVYGAVTILVGAIVARRATIALRRSSGGRRPPRSFAERAKEVS
jgi:hypothetical protein